MNRIAGFRSNHDGTYAAVWMKRDPETDYVEIYDACLFGSEVFPVIAESIIARGRYIPMAWAKGSEKSCEELRSRGVRFLPDPCEDTEEFAEVVSREIDGRMQGRLFAFKKELGNWAREYSAFSETQGKVPLDGFPLMSATRYAFAMRKSAKSFEKKRKVYKVQRAAII